MARKYDESDAKIRPARSTRPRSKDRPSHENAIRGFVIQVDRGRTSCVTETGVLVSAMKARELGKNSVVVGDHVALVGDTSGSEGSLSRIVSVYERKNSLNIGSQSYNTHFYFYIVIIIGSLCNIISSFLIAITLFHLKLNYDTIQETIRYSPKNRKQLNNYKSLFVTNILSIFVLLIIIIYYTDNDIVIGKFKMDYLIKIIKYILSGLIVGISGYILYLSNSLSRMWSSKMKILRNDNEKNDYMKPIPQNSWRGYDITRYITPQYIMNFKWS